MLSGLRSLREVLLFIAVTQIINVLSVSKVAMLTCQRVADALFPMTLATFALRWHASLDGSTLTPSLFANRITPFQDSLMMIPRYNLSKRVQIARDTKNALMADKLSVKCS